MKILFILNTTSATGGANKSLIPLIEYLTSNGHDIGIVCPNKNEVYHDLQNMGVQLFVSRYTDMSVPSITGFKNILKFIPRILKKIVLNRSAMKSFADLITEFNPDIIHENTSVTNIGYKLAKLLKCPYIFHIREYCNVYKPIGYDRIINDRNVHSVTITHALEKLNTRPTKDLNTVIYDAIIKEESIQYTPVKTNYFLYAGRIEPNKGVLDLIKAYNGYYKKVQEPIPLVLVGSTPDLKYWNTIQSYISSNNLNSAVKYEGEKSDLTSYYKSTISTIVPSYFEGLGRIFPEAMAMGSLCIGRNTTGTKEHMDNGREITGKEIAFGFNSIPELTQILINIHNEYINGNPFEPGNIYHQMIMRSQFYIKKYFTYSKSGENFEKLYFKLNYDQNPVNKD